MPEYKEYSKNVWDYIKDLPYMPSRKDREKLFLDKETYQAIQIEGIEYTRVQLWDYFFRIKPEDIGKPQEEEIAILKDEIQKRISDFQKKEEEIKEKLVLLEKDARRKAVLNFLIGIVVFGIIVFILSNLSIIENLSTQRKISTFMVFFLVWFFIDGLLIYVLYNWGEEKKEIRALLSTLSKMKLSLSEKNTEAEKRIDFLEKAVARLRRQIPVPLDGNIVGYWLDREYDKLWNYTKEDVALVRELFNEKDERFENKNETRENPEERDENDQVHKRKAKKHLRIIGPGELQKEIPRRFQKDVNEDFYKHLMAKQSSFFSNELDDGNGGNSGGGGNGGSGGDEDGNGESGRNTRNQTGYDVQYGVDFLEYIVVGKDMLVTHSFFYDFIDDVITAEYTTEQYYTDVVALAIEKKAQKITTINRNGNIITFYIEDSPAFSLSLKSGETHRVVFVSENYFANIRDRLELELNEIDQIYWIDEAQNIAEDVIRNLRYYLRQHKTLD